MSKYFSFVMSSYVIFISVLAILAINARIFSSKTKSRLKIFLDKVKSEQDPKA